MTATITEEVVETRTSDEPGDSAHIVLVPAHLRGKMSAQAYVLEAAVYGLEVEALCGYRWIPHRDPKVLPVCDKCLEEYNSDERPGPSIPDA